MAAIVYPNKKSKDYYSILNISKSADETEIKKAYHFLAKKYHPDENQNDTANNDFFQEIAEAYSILGNPKKRKMYDRYGYRSTKNKSQRGYMEFTNFAEEYRHFRSPKGYKNHFH